MTFEDFPQLSLRDACTTAVDTAARSESAGYDRVVIDAIELAPSLSDEWIASALRDSMELELFSCGLAQQASESANRDVALRVMLLDARVGQTPKDGRDNPSFTLVGRVELFDQASGTLVGSAPLQAVYVDDPCKGGYCVIKPVPPDEQELRQGAVDQFASRVAELLADARKDPARLASQAG